jgi:metal-sulfur cluster biosynthetic enzyme
MEQSKNIEVKKEVINALREIKDLDINGNVERMRMYNKKSKSKNRTL